MSAGRLRRSREHTQAIGRSINEFPAEDIPRSTSTATNRWRIRLQDRRTMCAAALCLVVLSAPTLLWFRSTASGAEAATGSLKVVSDPDGAAVSIDGKAIGPTPVSLTLRPGVHRLLV